MTRSRAPRHRSAAARTRREARAAVAGIALFVFAAYLIFSGSPAGGGFTLNAQLANATQLRADNPVRIAGVPVGKVTGLRAGPRGTTIVEMELKDEALPLHADATVHVESRLALEGNFAVRLSPGGAEGPQLRSGATIPLARTSRSVQLDQVIDIFDVPTRGSLQTGVGALAEGLGPRRAETSGARALRSSFQELDRGLGDLEALARGARGRKAGDLPRAVRGIGTVSRQLSTDRQALADISANTRTVGASLLAADGALADSIRRLRTVLGRAPGTLRALDRALPSVARFAPRLQTVLEQAAVDLPPTGRFVRELGRLAGPQELPLLTRALRPLTRDLPRVEQVLAGTFPFVGRIAECLERKIVPALTMKVPDGKLSTGRPAYQDLVHGFTRLSAANPSFDANGRILRAVAAGGEKTLTALVPPFGQAVAGIAPDIQGAAPIWLGPGVAPPWEPGADCRGQALPDLTKRRNAGPLSGITEVPRTRSSPSSGGPDAIREALAELRRAQEGGR